MTVLPDSRLKPGVAVNIRGTHILFVSEQDMSVVWGKSMPEIAAHLNTMRHVGMTQDIFEGCLTWQDG